MFLSFKWYLYCIIYSKTFLPFEFAWICFSHNECLSFFGKWNFKWEFILKLSKILCIMYVDKFSKKIVLLLQKWFEGTAGSFPMKDSIKTNLTLIQFVVLCNYHYIFLSTIKSSEFNIMCLNHLRILSRIYWDIFFLQISTIFNVLISRDVVESIWWYMPYTFIIIIFF